MRICVEFEIDCPVEAAWEALHSPRIVAELYAPLIRLVGPRAMPERFTDGDRVRVSMKVFGVVPLGSQIIVIDNARSPQFADDARTMRDIGRPLTGPLALLSGWCHEMTVWTSRSGRVVWHDELKISGVFAPAFWPVLAVMWRWRQYKLVRLARDWTPQALEY